MPASTVAIVASDTVEKATDHYGTPIDTKRTNEKMWLSLVFLEKKLSVAMVILVVMIISLFLSLARSLVLIRYCCRCDKEKNLLPCSGA